MPESMMNPDETGVGVFANDMSDHCVTADGAFTEPV